MMLARLALASCLLTLVPAVADAQQPGRVPALTVSAGYAGFIDDAQIGHGVAGAGAEWLLLPRVAVGPEVLYMVGPGDDRDLFVLGVARIGVRPLRTRVAPFVTVGGGLMRHSDTLNGVGFSRTEGALIAGGGVRITVSPRVHVAPELTAGWELHWRASVGVGIAMN